MRPVLIVALAYLLGSIPFGYLLVRLVSGADVRETGSGGTGATNVSRRAGKGIGVLTLLLDAGKGVAAVLLARALAPSAGEAWAMASLAAPAALVGHCFPVWLGFRGGKGVATGLGSFAVLAPIAVAVAAGVFLLVAWSTRYISLGSLVAATILPVLIAVEGVTAGASRDATYLLPSAIAGWLLIVYQHRENIKRLRQGTESKFG